jgi:hypothetical protein
MKYVIAFVAALLAVLGVSACRTSGLGVTPDLVLIFACRTTVRAGRSDDRRAWRATRT